MALMTWNNDYSVGVKLLDDQHMVLVETLNELHDAMMKGHARSVVGSILGSLIAYTREHFKSEEDLLNRTHYPTRAQHHQLHVSLTQQVEEFAGRFERGEMSVSLQLLNFLRDWLMTHILKEDKHYGQWLNEHGMR